MNRGAMRLGLVLSGALLLLFSWILLMKRPELSGAGLGEWGSFIGGAASALAFVWLVIGYFQNNQALQMQAEELRSAREETERRRLVEKLEAQPLLVPNGGSGGTGGHWVSQFRNARGAARNLRIKVVEAPDDIPAWISPQLYLDPAGQGQISLGSAKDGKQPYPVTVVIEYVDHFGSPGAITLDILELGDFRQRL